MKYYTLSLTLILFVFLFCTSKSFALDTFYKSPRNPLPVETNLPNWRQHGLYQPHVLVEEGIYKMWYASLGDTNFSIAYATSTNGTDWTADTLIPFNGGSSNYNPHVVKDNGVYNLYMSSDLPGSKAVIRKASSMDGIAFDPSSASTVLQPTEEWESNGLFGPFVTKENGKSYMFYTGWGNRGFQIGLAVSDDGNTWKKCTNNPVVVDVAADSAYVIKQDATNYLFYHSTGGIKVMESSDDLSCAMSWSNRKMALTYGPGSYDQTHMIAPSVFQKDDDVYLYYSGLGPQGWTINMASTAPLVSPHKSPIVFVPGLFASWNKDALVYQKQVAPDSWILNPAVHEYDGIINTMPKLGYANNKDFYVFHYDWRKSIEDITYDLDTYIHTHVLPDHPDEQINLVGHSLGGLVARLYGQRYGISTIKKIVTVGSPHLGSAMAYKAVEAGELETQNSFEWLMQKLVIQLYRDGISTDKEIVTKKLPIFQDLLPVYDFLQNADGVLLPASSMVKHNSVLSGFNQQIAAINPVMANITGNGNQTVGGYVVKKRSTYHELLDLYPDGVPVKTVYLDGDGIVTASSSSLPGTATFMNANHGEVIYASESLQKLMTMLNVPATADKIVSGKQTVASPSLFFLVMSPAEIEVEHKGVVYKEQEGIILIENAQSGSYTLSAKGKAQGTYKVLIGQFADHEVFWSHVSGQITAANPASQIDRYTIIFDPAKPYRNPVNGVHPEDTFEYIIQQLKETEGSGKDEHVKEAIKHLHRAQEAYKLKKYAEMRAAFEIAVSQMLRARSRASAMHSARIMETISQTESLYADIASPFSETQKRHYTKMLNVYISQFDTILKRFVMSKHEKDSVHNTKPELQYIQDRITIMQEALQQNRKLNTVLYLASVKQLLLNLGRH
ncbi:MAG: hypothetical protein RI947_862 [Candidatus Parcubacteria bacterium]|jgi:predicted GH43/DUF377 family glycosyl hydrolase